MTVSPADWAQLVRTIQSLGLIVISVDPASGRMVIQVPMLQDR